MRSTVTLTLDIEHTRNLPFRSARQVADHAAALVERSLSDADIVEARQPHGVVESRRATPATPAHGVSYIRPGTRLPNGATVIDGRAVGPISYGRAEGIVLALTPWDQSPHPFVTWRVNIDTGVTVAGDYCQTFEGAVRSYAARTGFEVEALGNGIDIEDIARDIDAVAHPDSEWARERREGTR